MSHALFRIAAHRAAALGLGAALAAAGGCNGEVNGGGGGDDDAPTDDANPLLPDAAIQACTPVAGTNLALEPVVAGLDEPLFVTSPPGDKRLFVLEKRGVIRIVEDGQLLDDAFLDFSDKVAWSMAPDEIGALGLAFHPDYASTGRFFVSYTAPNGGQYTDVLAGYQVSATDPNVADPTQEPILQVEDFASNHNGGMLAFGKDGYLYVGMGDGGDGGDPNNNGQDKTTLLGDMLRIDVDSDNPYGIPADNPYVGSPGGAREEIWLSGVRNPWRWSFDRKNGDLYIGDVGQGQTEEVDVLKTGQQAGLNLGWDEVEGDHCYDDQPTAGDPDADANCTIGNYTPPVLTYEHGGNGRSVIGGYVYRGTCSPEIDGWYFYADWNQGHVFKMVYSGGAATEKADVTTDLDEDGVLDGIASFGEDTFGEVYVVSLYGGTVHRIVVH